MPSGLSSWERFKLYQAPLKEDEIIEMIRRVSDFVDQSSPNSRIIVSVQSTTVSQAFGGHGRCDPYVVTSTGGRGITFLNGYHATHNFRHPFPGVLEAFLAQTSLLLSTLTASSTEEGLQAWAKRPEVVAVRSHFDDAVDRIAASRTHTDRTNGADFTHVIRQNPIPVELYKAHTVRLHFPGALGAKDPNDAKSKVACWFATVTGSKWFEKGQKCLLYFYIVSGQLIALPRVVEPLLFGPTITEEEKRAALGPGGFLNEVNKLKHGKLSTIPRIPTRKVIGFPPGEMQEAMIELIQAAMVDQEKTFDPLAFQPSSRAGPSSSAQAGPSSSSKLPRASGSGKLIQTRLDFRPKPAYLGPPSPTPPPRPVEVVDLTSDDEDPASSYKRKASAASSSPKTTAQGKKKRRD